MTLSLFFGFCNIETKYIYMPYHCCLDWTSQQYPLVIDVQFKVVTDMSTRLREYHVGFIWLQDVSSLTSLYEIPSATLISIEPSLCRIDAIWR